MMKALFIVIAFFKFQPLWYLSASRDNTMASSSVTVSRTTVGLPSMLNASTSIDV